MNDRRTQAVEYIEAVGARDLQRVVKMLDPDVTYVGPGGMLSGAESYVVALQKLMPILRDNSVIDVLADKNRACIVYDFNTSTSAGAIRSMEWLTFEEDRIARVELLFDLGRWPAVLEELQRRAQAAIV